MSVFSENRRKFEFTCEVDYSKLDKDFKVDSDLIVDGCFVFTKEGRLLTWVSEWLSDRMESNDINHNTAREYAKVITYFLDFLIDREHRFKRSKPKSVKGIQDLLLNVNSMIVLEYHNRRCADLDNGTNAFRDVVIKSFFEEYICNARYGDNNGIALLDECFNPYRDSSSASGTKRLFLGKAKVNDEGGGGAISLDNLMDYMVIAKSERERCMYQFMYDTGLRVGELSKIMVSDITDALQRFSNRLALDAEENGVIDYDYKALMIKGVKPRHREEFKPRVTLASKITLIRLQRYFEDRRGFYRKNKQKANGHAFLAADGSPITKESINYYVKSRFKEGKSLGLFEGRLMPITPHKFRHGFAVACLTSSDYKADPHDRMVALSKWLGHTHVSTTEKHYQNIAVELQHNLQTGELLNRCDLMNEVYAKSKPSQIGVTISERIGAKRSM